MNIRLVMPNVLYVGDNMIQKLADEAVNLGKKPLIVTDDMMIQFGYQKSITEVLEAIGQSWAIFSDIKNEPTQVSVYDGLKTYRDKECDYIIALGGGSCIDTAKAVAMMATNNVSIEDIGLKRATVDKNSCPLIVIPTTAGTGSEVTDVSVITDTVSGTKMMMKDRKFMPTVSIVDPLYTKSAPKSVTAATGLDAFCHALESFVSIKANEVTRQFSLQAIKAIMEYLPICYLRGNDILAREKMSLAATEAGIAFSNASVTLIHGMSRPIGALFHVTHGISNAMLIGVFLDYSKEAIAGDLAQISRYVFPTEIFATDSEAMDYFVDKVKELCALLEVPNLRGYGVDQDAFVAATEKMAKDALLSGSPQNNPKVPSQEELVKLYLQVYDYEF